MSLTSELSETKRRLAIVEEELLQLRTALDAYFSTLPREQYAAWKRAKSGGVETPGDVTVGKNLPQAPVKTLNNGIGL